MRVQRRLTGQFLDLAGAQVLGFGREARLVAVPGEEALAAKLYVRPLAVHARKLGAMLANPPLAPRSPSGYPAITWPLDLLCAGDDSEQVVGCLIRHIAKARPLAYVFAEARHSTTSPFPYELRLRAAGNLARALHALHARGHVIGDVNATKILVGDDAWITLIEPDSFQICDPQTGLLYPCSPAQAPMVPPELQPGGGSDVLWSPEHDRFGLAVLIFQLLMGNVHPFAGIYAGEGKAPPLEARIAAGHFPYGREHPAPYGPIPTAPSYQTLPPELQDLFLRCFQDGHRNPAARPDARAWEAAVEAALAALAACALNPQHRYSNHLAVCPWCGSHGRLSLTAGSRVLPLPQAATRPEALETRAPRRPARVAAGSPGGHGCEWRIPWVRLGGLARRSWRQAREYGNTQRQAGQPAPQIPPVGSERPLPRAPVPLLPRPAGRSAVRSRRMSGMRRPSRRAWVTIACGALAFLPVLVLPFLPGSAPTRTSPEPAAGSAWELTLPSAPPAVDSARVAGASVLEVAPRRMASPPIAGSGDGRPTTVRKDTLAERRSVLARRPDPAGQQPEERGAAEPRSPAPTRLADRVPHRASSGPPAPVRVAALSARKRPNRAPSPIPGVRAPGTRKPGRRPSLPAVVAQRPRTLDRLAASSDGAVHSPLPSPQPEPVPPPGPTPPPAGDSLERARQQEMARRRQAEVEFAEALERERALRRQSEAQFAVVLQQERLRRQAEAAEFQKVLEHETRRR